jgi:hypothetical protein
MTRQDVAVVAVAALATAFVAVGIDLAGVLFAAESPQAEIRWPVLKHGAVEITLRGPKGGMAAELEAVNSGCDPETVHGTLCLMCQTTPDPMSRAMPMAVETWKQEVEISLGAGERKVLTFAPDEKTRTKFGPQPSIVAVGAKPSTATAPTAERATLGSAGRGNMQPGFLVYYKLRDGKNSIATQPVAFASPVGAASAPGASASAPLQLTIPQGL